MAIIYKSGYTKLTEANTIVINEQFETIDKQIAILQKSKQVILQTFNVKYETYLRRAAALKAKGIIK
jgi:hypothetical protein